MARPDDIGFFWEDLPTSRKRGEIIRPMPPIPDTGWVAPKEFPNLSAASAICFDVEAKDVDLLTKGPGWARGDGHIVGVSVGVPDGHRWYFPMRHEVEPEDNMNPDHVMSWLGDTLGDPRQPKVGANTLYDIGRVTDEGIHVAGPVVDIQFAEALLSERALVSLEAMGQKYLGEGKPSNVLYQWCADFYGGEPNGGQRKNIWRAPPRLVGPYAEGDVDLPLRLASVVYPLLHQHGLMDVFNMENRLLPLLMEMRFAGVSVDVERAEALREHLVVKEAETQARLDNIAGFEVGVTLPDSLGRLFDDLGIPYALTPKTKKPSITTAYLENLTHPVGDVIREIKKLQKLRGTFVEGYILDSHVNGKLYCELKNMRRDDGGTRSGRFAMANPNGQNIPARDLELAPLIRGLFIPDDGHKCWRSYDYSQIEYRDLASDAIGPSGEDVRQRYRRDPSTDYHNMAQALIKEKTGIELQRKQVKTVNFGLVYGMGVSKLSESLGLSQKAGKELFKAYHAGVPFVKETMDHYMDLAQRTGEIRTIMGRKSYFDLWEPTKWPKKGEAPKPALPYEKAIMVYGSIKRAYTHKALNRRLQGSAADIMKAAMLKCYEDGIFAETGVPRLTVHDELDFSDPGGKDEAFNEMQRVMETALPLNVPLKVELETGPDWGHVS